MSHSPTRSIFPNPRNAPRDAPLAMGGRLNVPVLREAYRSGIFPWFSPGQPILWWCPDPRFVLRPEDTRVNRSLAKEARKSYWRITFNEAFGEVIRGCAETARPDQDGTWITDDMISAYEQLHETGLAHSVECWRDGELAGGCYGVAMGAAFFGESMFFRQPNASKVAFVHLTRRLTERGYQLIDCQQRTEHLARFGATLWPRTQFLDELANAVKAPVSFA
ncbi:MAG: leucyl/phenylalanyl-tRNA--protein transferase [Puniceicoccales bacterium]